MFAKIIVTEQHMYIRMDNGPVILFLTTIGFAGDIESAMVLIQFYCKPMLAIVSFICNLFVEGLLYVA